MTTQPSLLFPLVGAYFRPPASALLRLLPAGTEVELRPEPENPYDSNAIAIWLAEPSYALLSLGEDRIAAELDGTGFSIEDLDELSEIQLGYLMSASNTRQAARCPAGEAWGSNLDWPSEVKRGRLLLSSDSQTSLIVPLID